MKYGFYDNDRQEYVITRPDTPAPWMNYLGNGGFSGLISNTGGGLIFNKDSSNFRITRYRFNEIPWDRPGRYLYFKDGADGEYWSPTWQPVQKELDTYKCRHGYGYTTIESSYKDIESSITYFIPLDKNYELWKVRVKNQGNTERTLQVFSYLEFSNYVADYDIKADWPRYFMSGYREENAVVFDPSDDWIKVPERLSFIGTNLTISGFDCDRDAFIGKYRSESNPVAVEKGVCSNSELNADNCCGSLCVELSFAPQEEKEFYFVVGITDDRKKIKDIIGQAVANEAQDFAKLHTFWEEHVNLIQVNTPDEEMNTMLNVWHPYQCRMTFNWSRFISYYERGLDRGWGYRDSMQDVLGVMHSVPEQAKERIKTLLGIQYSRGDARAVYYPGTGKSSGGGRSDDHLWGIFSVCSYIRETGDYAFLDEEVPYVDGEVATVCEHLMQGLTFTREHTGEHGVPLFLHNDWNDSLKSIAEQGKGESAFVFFQAAHAAYELKLLFEKTGDKEKLAWATEYYDWCKEVYQVLWDGKWFLRGFTDEGEKFGTDDDEWNKIFLNPQSWAILSRLPSDEQGQSAFDNVRDYLFTDMGVMSHAPASTGINIPKKSYFGLKSGVRENGGLFFHASTWAIIAETILGRNEEAYSLYHRELPTMRNDKVDMCMIEPHVYASSMIAPHHERAGQGVGSWLSGTASWMYVAATQYILGFRPDYDGVCIDPCIPTSWEGFTMDRMYRGCKVTVVSGQLPHEGAKAKALCVDGVRLEGNFVPANMLEGKDSVKIDVIYEYLGGKYETL